MSDQNVRKPTPQLAEGYGNINKPEDFFTLEQRLDAISEILAEITLEAMKKKF